MTAQEARELFKANALKAGLTEEQIKGTLEAWGSNEAFSKVMTETFVPRPEVDRTISDYTKKVEAADKNVNTWREWYEKQAKPAYESNLKTADKLKKYESTYGELNEDSTFQQKAEASKSTGLTMEQLEEKLKERDNAYVGFTKTMMKISQDYSRRFGEDLDVDALEEFVRKRGVDPQTGYELYVAPKVKEREAAQHQAELKAAREEAVRDYASKHRLPTDNAPKEPHMIFDADQMKLKEGVNPDRASRDAFMDGYQNYAELTKTGT